MGKRLSGFLKAHKKVGLNTSPFIYFIEDHPQYSQICLKIFSSIEQKNIFAVSSTLTLLEILVKPYRLKDEKFILKAYALLTTFPNLKWIDLSLEIADKAAQLRAQYNFSTPDSIHLASSLISQCTGFLCNDVKLRRFTEMDVLILDECRAD